MTLEKHVETSIDIFNTYWKEEINCDALKRKYHNNELMREPVDKLIRKEHRALGEAIRLINYISSTGSCSYYDLKRAWEYWYVVVNSAKYSLDFKKARLDLGIDSLKKQFMK